MRVILVLLALPVVSCVKAPPVVERVFNRHPIEFVRYEVSFTEPESVLQAVREALRPYGLQSVGHTKWSVNWQFDRETRHGRCYVTKARVGVTTRIWLPGWKEEELVENERFREAWKKYSQRLELHEKDHALIGELAGRRVLELIADAAPEDTCEVLDSQLEKKISETISLYDKQNVVYDRATRNGYLQGISIELVMKEVVDKQ